MIAALLEISRPDSGGSLAQQHHMEHELRGFIGGLQLFSERSGISIDKLLTFSVANDQKLLNERLQKQEKMSDEDAVLAKSICSMIEELWKNRAPHTTFNDASASRS
jgi:hypothetical protein